MYSLSTYNVTLSLYAFTGAKEDGTSVYFFHKTANAYATGQRKRRKIQNEDSSGKEHVRWHKTGKTKPVLENGTQKGSKKIMVLYRSAVNGSKPEKSNWVMHQYHLGTEEDEKDGDYVVSRIFYQHQKQGEKIDGPVAITESSKVMLHTSPKTPKTNTPNPPRPGNSGYLDDIMDEFQLRSSTYVSGTSFTISFILTTLYFTFLMKLHSICCKLSSFI